MKGLLQSLVLVAALMATNPMLRAAEISPSVRALHEGFLTLDTHLDTTALLDDPTWNVLERHAPENSQVDYPRMVEGGLDGGFWVIYTAQQGRSQADHRVARDHGLRRLISIHRMVAANPDKFELALSSDDARRIVGSGKRPVFISLENASPLTTDPVSLLRFYHAQGVRMMGLVHGANNEFADSATALPEWRAISPAGREIIAEANRLGIILDQSHAADEVFDQLIELSKAPIILSHSGASDVFDHPRNIDDARLRRLAAKGGVIHVNSLGDYLTETGRTPAYRAEMQAIRGQLAATPSGPQRDARFVAARAELDRKYNVKNATLEDYFRHIEHILKVVGPDHVGLGADWDGGGGVLGYEDITALPKVTQWLVEKGYSTQQIANIHGGNVLRLLDDVQAVAKSLQAEEASGKK